MCSAKAFFPLEAFLLAIDRVETGLPTKLPSLARVNLSFTNAGVPLPSLLILPLRQGRHAPEVDLMASQTDVQFLTFRTFA